MAKEFSSIPLQSKKQTPKTHAKVGESFKTKFGKHMNTFKRGIIGAFAVVFASAIHMSGQNTLRFTAVKATTEGAVQLRWQVNPTECIAWTTRMI